MLARKGYGGGVASRAVREALGELAAAADGLADDLEAHDVSDERIDLDELPPM